MIASYRLQLTPEFGFEQALAQLPYLRRLGVSHLYLSPITEAVQGSLHGYDVIDHNRVRAEFGGRDAFEALREAAIAHGLELILDVVPNHAGVGADNEAWQDLLAYGPSSPYAITFDVDWNPLKAELRGRLLLPFLGRPYGAVLDDGELRLAYDDGYFYAEYYDNRFRLSPASYQLILEEALPALERREGYFDLLELRDLYLELSGDERDKAEALRGRLSRLAAAHDFAPALASFEGERLHRLLERQFWRLSYWKTAGDEINYRRFFDVNELVALRMEEAGVFWEAHRLLSELLLEEGIAGVRVDHVDGLNDPHAYLAALATLGPSAIWVEKILAPGEPLPPAWPVSGTTGYEFMNDASRLLVYPGGEGRLRETYRHFLDSHVPYSDEVVRSKRLIMETSLAGELTRLAGILYRLSEADYHTRDFTMIALRAALADVIASFDRYRTYLPYETEGAGEVLRRATSEAKRRAENVETSVHEFILRCLCEPFPEPLEPLRGAFVARFQQYTAPVAAKGVEDTAFYRYVPLIALNEVGGEPDHFTVELQAFHSRARFRQHRYPRNLLATATHDHKRGEDTRMRLAALSEFADDWRETLQRLDERAQRHLLETSALGAPRISRNDSYLLYQHLLALWQDEQPESLAPRLQQYMLKAVREAKRESSWIDPDAGYEAAVQEFTAAMTGDSEVAEIIGPLAERLANYGFRNGLSQLVLKLTTPGVPDIYQGTELMDLSLVDPDNRRPVDYAERERILDELSDQPPEPRQLREWRSQRQPKLKMLLLHRLLRLRADRASLFEGSYLPLETSGEPGEEGDDHLVAFSRESDEAQLVVLVPRFLAVLERTSGGWGGGSLSLPPALQGGGWREVVSREDLPETTELDLAELPFLPAVLLRDKPAGKAGEER